ncbi:MAG: uracil phosphoribosyltransferase [Phycisphaera sp.]|nr:uracil phosphoribosyltransferase [Phycisphaera sp.]
MPIHIADHPLIADKLAEARDEKTPPLRFRQLVSQIGALLAYEATRDLDTTLTTIRTPLEEMQVRVVKKPITIVPILRAGLGLAEGIMDLLPDAHVGHVGMFRDDSTLNPVSYYRKIPVEAREGVTLLVDPMLATGGSAIAAVSLLKDHGCPDIRMIALVAAPEGWNKLHREHPDVPVYTAALDRQLNNKGFILPGLGDAGDRLFGTTGR